MTMSPVGTRFEVTQRAKPSLDVNSSFETTVVSASGGVDLRSSWARPPSSDLRSSGRTCASHGLAASIVAGSSSMLGVSSIASARNGGSASESAASDGRASSTVGASSAIVSLRLSDSAASAPANTLKFVIRPWSSVSWPSSRPNSTRWARIRPERSWPLSPSSASLTIAVSRPAGPP